MKDIIAAFAVIAANFIIFLAASQVRGGIAADTLIRYYQATELWHRLLIAGFIYSLIIGPFTYAFQLNASLASFTQAVMGALMVMGLAVTLGGKAITLQIVISTAVVALGSVYLAWAVMVAPIKPT